MENIDILNEIQRLKAEKNAVIVAHNYQIDEIQEMADMVGDSFALSKYCAQTEADVIVFCGVSFMAESAKILAPQKTVLLPELDAGCPMADMIDADGLRKFKEKYRDAATVCYVNSSAEVKAECDICCTSSNAVKVIQSLDAQNIIFAPDQNLGSYVSKMVPEKNIILWAGFCPTHNKVKPQEVQAVKEIHPDAQILVHPECPPEVVEIADFVGSTSQIIKYAAESEHDKFIIGTEMGIMYKLKKDSPQKTFYLLTQGLFCPNMKKTSLQSVYDALNDMKNEITLDENIRIKAKDALDRMLAVE